MKIELKDEANTLELAKQIAQASLQPMRFFLVGDLGAGKTTFARGFLAGLGYSDLVKSPTYTLVEAYELSPIPVYHFDWYRLCDPNELENIGLWDYLNEPAHCLIEWPEKGHNVFNSPDMSLIFSFEGSRRFITLQPHTPLGDTLLTKLEDLSI